MIFHLLIPLLLGTGLVVALLTEQQLRDRLKPFKAADTDVAYLVRKAMENNQVQYVAGVFTAGRTSRYETDITAEELSPELKKKVDERGRIEFTL